MDISVDHIHVFVSSQYEAAAWYERVLGLTIVKEHEDWAVDGGPLTISGDGGKTGIALFDRRSGKEPNYSTVAFRLSGIEFIGFLDRLEDLSLLNRDGGNVSSEQVSDHEKSWSIYFVDPYENPIELTTYDYDLVKNRNHLGKQ